MTRVETSDIKKLTYTVVSLILGYYTYEIFLGYFRICAALGFLGAIIRPFAFVDWLIDFKKRRGRRSKKIHRRITRMLYAIFAVGIIVFGCSKIGVAHEKFKELSIGTSEYVEVSVTEKGKLGLMPRWNGIFLKVLDKINKDLSKVK